MDSLNMGIIKGIPIRLPPVEMQVEFQVRLAVAIELRERASASSAALESVAGSLRQRAFAGEL